MVRRKHDVRRGDGFIDVRKTRDGTARYRARWYEGSVLRSRTFGTQHAAEDHLRTVGRAMRSGTYEPESRLTVATMLDEYFERMRRDKWTSNTYANYVSIRTNIINPAIGKRLVAQIRPRDMRIFMDRLQSEYSASRVVVIKAILSGAFREAVGLGIIERNPLADIRVKTPNPKRIDVWTLEDVKKLLAHVADDARSNAWYRLALSTGMRPGEMRALAWHHINFQTNTIHVSDTVSRDDRFRTYIKKGTKTGKSRKVRIPESTAKALSAYRPDHLKERLRADSWHNLDLVFPRPDGRELSQQTQARRHRDTLLAAGVPYLKPHGMRHTVITILMEAGMNEKLVGEIVGHRRPAQTLAYNQPTQRAHEDAAAYMDASLSMGEKGESVGESGEHDTDVV